MKRLGIMSLAGMFAMMGSVMAQPACPSGESLKQQALAAQDRFNDQSSAEFLGNVPSSVGRRARAYFYLVFASVADNKAAQELTFSFTSYIIDCHPDDCPAGIPLTAAEKKEVSAYIRASLKASRENAARPVMPSVYREIPTPERIRWAEDVLNCSYNGQGTIKAQTTPPPQTYTPPKKTYSSSNSSSSSTSSTPAPAPAPTQRVVTIYGDWAYGQGYYCTNNENQTDLYAKANSRKACTDQGGYDGGTYISNSGYNGYKPNAEQCYQAKAYTKCVFDE